MSDETERAAGLKPTGTIELSGVWDIGEATVFADEYFNRMLRAARRTVTVRPRQIAVGRLALYPRELAFEATEEWDGPLSVTLKPLGSVRIERAAWWRRAAFWALWPFVAAWRRVAAAWRRDEDGDLQD